MNNVIINMMTMININYEYDDQDDEQDPPLSSLSLFASAITPISNKQTHVCSTPTSLKYYYIH